MKEKIKKVDWVKVEADLLQTKLVVFEAHTGIFKAVTPDEFLKEYGV